MFDSELKNIVPVVEPVSDVLAIVGSPAGA